MYHLFACDFLIIYDVGLLIVPKVHWKKNN